MNKVILVGNLTRDPELNTTNTGIAVCRLGIAVNRPYTNAKGEREVDFISITAWRNIAENCHKYLRKGSKVAVSGSLQIRNYEDQDGNKRTSAEVVADDIEFLSTKQNEDQDGFVKQKKQKQTELEPVGDDELLPF